MTTTATARLLELLSLLQTRRDWPGALLADRLRISHRTVRRDVDRLRELGYRIEATMGPDGGYRLDAGSELPPLLLDDEQVVAIAVALQHAAGTGTEEAALRALTTLRQVMPARLRHRLDAVTFATVGRPGEAAPTPTSTDVLVTLSTAVRDGVVLRFDHAAPDDGYEHALTDDPPAEPSDDAPPRRVEPHALVASGGRWYLLAWDLDRSDWRIFRADRVTPRTPTGPRFTPRPVPGGDARAYVSARFKGSPETDAWPCTGTVLLDLPARRVRPFAGDGTVEPVGRDRCRYTSGAWSWVALAASLLRFDCPVEVEGPPALADAFATLAGRSAAAAG